RLRSAAGTEQRLHEALTRHRRGRKAARVGCGRCHAHDLIEEMRVPPEDMKGLIEKRAMLDSARETGLEHVVQLAPSGDARELQRLQREHGAVAADRQPCLA